MSVCSVIGQLGRSKLSHHSRKLFVAAKVLESLSNKARQLKQSSNILLSRMILRVQSEISNMYAAPHYFNGYRFCHPNTNVVGITKS